ncbi:hypothetical protein [Halorhabdus rudnickae]|uniref:hypothetical protein n=1 Tax=Halorhabdus rudnickae TaxID=1775544 RepID=UPI0010839A5B|nr:hypothetical protein [Halorhabdus rudnickae]
MVTLSLDEKESEKNSSLNSKNNVSIDTIENKIHLWSKALIAGNANATARLFTQYTPDEDGDYEVSVDYFKNADLLLANAELSVIVRDSFGLSKHKVCDISGGSDDEKRSVNGIELDAGTEYDIGIEIFTNAGAFMNETYADLYNSKSLPPEIGPRHRFVLNEFKMRKD